MIELTAAEHDDAGFLALAQRIVNGVIMTMQMREVYIVHIDNWFDYKWLEWRSRKGEDELRVPLFSPNRVHTQKRFVWDVESLAWTSVGMPRPLHIRQAGRPSLAQPLDRFSNRAVFIWYSGNTTTNKVGSLMIYVSGAEGYAWYTSFRKDADWTVADEFRITRRELESFEERGRQMEAIGSK